MPAFAINSWIWGQRICCRLQSVDAHNQEEGFEFCWIGNFDDVEKSYDGHNSQWWSADSWRGHSLYQRIGYILDNESLRGYASSFIARKALRWTRILILVDQRSKNHISFKMMFEYSVIRKTWYRSWILVYLRVLPQASLLQHPWHLQGRKLIILRLPQARLPHHPWNLQKRLIIQITLQQSCPAKVWIDKYGETRILLKR